MSRIAIGRVLPAACAAILMIAHAESAPAAPPGVETRVRPTVTGEERSRQPDIWAMEVYYKSVRMIWVDIPDPKTGKTQRELIWYLPYRVVNRQIKGSLPPVGPDGKRPKFVPEFELVTKDNGVQHVYFDEIIPVAQAAINRREGRTGSNRYKNSVEIVGAIPELTDADAKLEQSTYGVAIWRGVDPKTDFFRIFMSGFSNGYIKVGDDRIDRRTIIQEYTRPGDELDQDEGEIKPDGHPEWIYRPSDDAAPKKP
ncbi:hypothetical protein [Symmachiella dynata]|uniref:Uncharacterized protein n=1 Tax=Symmachiella dynata TaxID=2527995 RepID=A0A517ZLB3_9PLAN|nr:hypothetical protein [Symmachiella dynata]QDU43284.1 hypothetical protein Mal52_17560 [Symmachiella dynata]